MTEIITIRDDEKNFSQTPTTSLSTMEDILFANQSVVASQQALSVYSEPVVQRAIQACLVLLPASMILGLFGNVIMIIIIGRMERTSTTDLFFLALASSDLCAIITGPLNSWINMLSSLQFSIQAQHDIVCKLFVFVSNVSSQASVWLLVAMSTQRVLAVTWPHRVSVLCTVRRIRGVIVAIVVVFCVYCSHILYGVEIVVSGGVRSCYTNSASYRSFLVIYFKYDVVLYSYLPIALLLVLNSVLVQKLRKSTTDFGDVASNVQQERRVMKVNLMTLTTVLVSTSFIVFSMPLTVYNLLFLKRRHAADIAYETIALAINYVNFSLNFYLYCLTGKRIRRAFFRLFSFCRKGPL